MGDCVDLFSMFMDVVQTIILHQQSTKKEYQHSAKQPFEIVRTAVVETQSGVDTATIQNNPPQPHAVSNSIQM
jgi:hypothetical protein